MSGIYPHTAIVMVVVCYYVRQLAVGKVYHFFLYLKAK